MATLTAREYRKRKKQKVRKRATCHRNCTYCRDSKLANSRRRAEKADDSLKEWVEHEER